MIYYLFFVGFLRHTIQTKDASSYSPDHLQVLEKGRGGRGAGMLSRSLKVEHHKIQGMLISSIASSLSLDYIVSGYVYYDLSRLNRL